MRWETHAFDQQRMSVIDEMHQDMAGQAARPE